VGLQFLIFNNAFAVKGKAIPSFIHSLSPTRISALMKSQSGFFRFTLLERPAAVIQQSLFFL
jgi:hypothetical protein